MEERLFWIGAAMGLYAWGTRWAVARGRLDTRWGTTLWHALFCAAAGFASSLIAVMSIESRSRFSSIVVGALSARELGYSLAGAAALGIWGLVSAYRNGASAEGRKHYHDEDLEWAETVFSAVLLASVMMYLVVQAFKIPSGSMRSTLLEGDHLFVNKFIYGVRIPFTRARVLRFKPISRGDIVVFRFPTEDPEDIHCGSVQYGKDFIKRAVGIPGDTIEVREGRLFVNGAAAGPEPYAQYVDVMRQPGPDFRLAPQEYQRAWQEHQLDRRLDDRVRDQFGPVVVPQGSYFMMGDNRDRSCDSRFWGPVEDHFVKGKAWVIYWPLSRMGRVQ